MDILEKHCEQYKKPVIRSFNCQQIGHIAKQCSRISLYHNCENQNHQNNICSNLSFCVSCNNKATWNGMKDNETSEISCDILGHIFGGIMGLLERK